MANFAVTVQRYKGCHNAAGDAGFCAAQHEIYLLFFNLFVPVLNSESLYAFLARLSDQSFPGIQAITRAPSIRPHSSKFQTLFPKRDENNFGLPLLVEETEIKLPPNHPVCGHPVVDYFPSGCPPYI